MVIYIIEARVPEEDRWVPLSHPYYRLEDANKALKRHKYGEYRVAVWQRIAS